MCIMNFFHFVSRFPLPFTQIADGTNVYVFVLPLTSNFFYSENLNKAELIVSVVNRTICPMNSFLMVKFRFCSPKRTKIGKEFYHFFLNFATFQFSEYHSAVRCLPCTGKILLSDIAKSIHKHIEKVNGGSELTSICLSSISQLQHTNSGI